MRRDRAWIWHRPPRRAVQSWTGERGIAMVTVLLVGAALTVMATSASFLAVRDLRSGAASNNGVKALGYAEAGLQRFLRELKLGSYGLGAVLKAGCSTPPVQLPEGRIGDGTYSAQLTVFDASTSPQVPPPWTGAASNGGPCGTARFTPPGPAAKDPWTYAVTATGRSGNATRVIRAVVTISSSGLPVGVFVNKVNANGNPSFGNISLFANSDVYGREKMTFSGNDLQYTIGDVYGPTAPNASLQIPAAVHSVGAIYMKANGKNTRLHPPTVNCSASQSLWDGSLFGGPILAPPPPPCPSGPYPPTSKFTSADIVNITGKSSLPKLTEREYAGMKAAAQATGLYCFIPTSGGPQCTVYNPATSTRVAYTLGTVNSNPIPNTSYVAYFEYAPGGDPVSNQRTINWNAAVSPCSDDPALNNSAVIVVRNGSIQFRSAATMYGNVVVPEGAVDVAGGYTITGSVIANDLRIRGNGTFRQDACGQRNSPAATMNVSGGRWSEIDR
ncbi:MAG TPA: pilus assembly PilX N-terminal domain-containing protein [Actinomycetota bacterium]|nr:pilus assembly PilX N-terminal domain-containing protein [Actinomycetota bacterium]